MPRSNQEALTQLVATVLAPILLLFGDVSLYLVWALAETSQLGPALLVLAASAVALLAAIRLQALATAAPPADAPAAADATPPALTTAPAQPLPPTAAGVSRAPTSVPAPPYPTSAGLAPGRPIAPPAPAATPPPARPALEPAPAPSAVAATSTSATAWALPFRLGLPRALPGAGVLAPPAGPSAPPGESDAVPAAPPTAVPLVRAYWFRALLVVLALVIPLAFRLVDLDDLPGELFGDIATIWESVDTVLKGKWPTTFEQSNGPLYGYVIAPIIALLGQQGFLPYKLASVIVGLLAIACTFLVVRELVGTDLALLASIVLSATSWHVIFSRLGNSQILAPTLVAGSLLLLVLGIKRQDFRLTVAGVFVASLSYYGYAPLLVLPGAYVLAAAFYVTRRQLAVLVALAGVLTLPFLFVILRQQDVFIAGSGYIGSKLLTDQNWVEKIAGNVWRSLLMYHGRGDEIFRVNSPGMSQLDIVSGIFLLVGIIYWLRRPQRHWLPLLLVPFVVLQLPANLVLNEAMPTPSASRSIGILPILAAVIAGGIWEAATRIRDARVLRPAFVVLIIGLICWLNWQRYFVAYAVTLPEQNSPYAKLMAAYVDTLPADATVVLSSCCWAQAGQPEPKGIMYVIKQPREIKIVERGRFSCAALNLPGPVDVIWDPHDDGPIPPPSCYPGAHVKIYSDARGQPVFKEFYIDRPAALTGPAPAATR
jgi:hypothetical protein